MICGIIVYVAGGATYGLQGPPECPATVPHASPILDSFWKAELGLFALYPGDCDRATYIQASQEIEI